MSLSYFATCLIYKKILKMEKLEKNIIKKYRISIIAILCLCTIVVAIGIWLFLTASLWLFSTFRFIVVMCVSVCFALLLITIIFIRKEYHRKGIKFLDSLKEDFSKRPSTVRISFVIAVICVVLSLSCIILEESNTFSPLWNNVLGILRAITNIIGIIAIVYVSYSSIKSKNNIVANRSRP
ncbi:membrane hypothetical protein [groundwater metagenome]|uniref:Uncharacterized protein n=1 Tax=groundwater metagenome TaxID=717931 RepID=A0A098E7V0_9ZZZZ